MADSFNPFLSAKRDNEGYAWFRVELAEHTKIMTAFIVNSCFDMTRAERIGSSYICVTSDE